MALPPLGNLICHWKMNDNAANTIVVDNRGLYNGTWTRNTSLDSAAGLAANTNTSLYCGGSNYADCGDVTSFNYNTPFSIALWCGGKNNGIVSKLNGTTNQGWELYWSISNFKIHFFLANSISGGTYIQRLTNAFNSTAIAHIVATYDGSGNRSGIKIYINGVRSDTTDGGAATLSSTIIGTGQTLRLGSRNGSAVYLKGLDDIRLYNIELTQANIDSIYNSGAGTEDEGASGAPVADFSADTTSFDRGTTVTFTDSSTNVPTSWAWDFGDGGTSTDQNPTHVYQKAGTYTVSLTATNAIGSDTETKVGYITVYDFAAHYDSTGVTGKIGRDATSTYVESTRFVGARPKMSTTTKTDTYAVLATDETVVCNKGTAMTVNLPASLGDGRRVFIKNIGAGVVTVDGNASETIDGETTQSLAQWECIEVISYVTGAWSII